MIKVGAGAIGALSGVIALFLALGTGIAAAAGPTSPSEQQGVQPVIKLAPGIHVARGSELASPAAPVPRAGARAPGAGGSAEAAPRIVGGSETTIASWPWQTSIGVHPGLASGASAFARHICGGSLVAPAIVVTAAHCFFHDDEFIPADFLQVVSGRTQLSTDTGQAHDLDDYYLFVDSNGTPLYNPSTGEWDVAFMKLSSDSSSGTIRIAGPDERPAWAAGSVAHVTGWGATSEGGDGSDVLRQALIEIIADSVCGAPEIYGAAFVPDVMLCAGNLAGGVDACQGDSGGPLVVPIGGGTFRLVGDTSWGLGCAQPNQPGVYGRLADDPIRSALRGGILEVAGVDVVGPPGPPPRPTDPSPRLQMTISPRRARVRSGAVRTFRVRVRNVGDAPARNVRACARTPRRKASIQGKACRRLGSIRPGAAKAQRFRARVSPRARGRFALRFLARAANHPRVIERARARVSG